MLCVELVSRGFTELFPRRCFQALMVALTLSFLCFPSSAFSQRDSSKRLQVFKFISFHSLHLRESCRKANSGGRWKGWSDARQQQTIYLHGAGDISFISICANVLFLTPQCPLTPLLSRSLNRKLIFSSARDIQQVEICEILSTRLDYEGATAQCGFGAL